MRITTNALPACALLSKVARARGRWPPILVAEGPNSELEHPHVYVNFVMSTFCGAPLALFPFLQFCGFSYHRGNRTWGALRS